MSARVGRTASAGAARRGRRIRGTSGWFIEGRTDGATPAIPPSTYHQAPERPRDRRSAVSPPPRAVAPLYQGLPGPLGRGRRRARRLRLVRTALGGDGLLVRELHPIEARVHTRAGDELVVGAHLDDAALV